jgi:hypothetical protein
MIQGEIVNSPSAEKAKGILLKPLLQISLVLAGQKLRYINENMIYMIF